MSRYAVIGVWFAASLERHVDLAAIGDEAYPDLTTDLLDEAYERVETQVRQGLANLAKELGTEIEVDQLRVELLASA